MPTTPRKPAAKPKTARPPKAAPPVDKAVKKIEEQGEPFDGNFA